MVDVTNNMLDDVNAATWETLSEVCTTRGRIPGVAGRPQVSVVCATRGGKRAILDEMLEVLDFWPHHFCYQRNNSTGYT